jgi:ADP-L-glycero-D-manno-heptose 6-epimerase
MLEGRTAQVAALRYFNVYGPNEAHKGRMASVAYHACQQLAGGGRVKLFVGSGGYGNGEQARFRLRRGRRRRQSLAAEHRGVSGVFNCGTGRAQSFNELAAAVINAVQGTRLGLRDLVAKGLIEYPPPVAGQQQSYTQLTCCLRAPATREFRPVEQAAAHGGPRRNERRSKTSSVIRRSSRSAFPVREFEEQEFVAGNQGITAAR